MSKNAETVDTTTADISLLETEMGSDMNARYFDKAFYYMMLDAAKVEKLELVGKNVFRTEVSRPVVDDVILDDEVVVGILEKLNHPKPI